MVRHVSIDRRLSTRARAMLVAALVLAIGLAHTPAKASIDLPVDDPIARATSPTVVEATRALADADATIEQPVQPRAAGAPRNDVALPSIELGSVSVVSPANLGGWTFQHSICSSDPKTGTSDFVTGPGDPRLGAGSVGFTIGADGNSFETIRNPHLHLVRLDSLTSLSYDTYVSAPATGWTGQAPYLLVSVDNNNDTTTDDLLFFEPEYQHGYTTNVPDQGDVVQNAWQTWDALAGGWWSLFGYASAGPGTGVKTIAQYLSANPDARIINTSSGLGGFRVATGCGAGAWDNFEGAADAVSVGIAGVETTWDFEDVPATPTVAIVDGGDDFINAAEAGSVMLTGTYDASNENITGVIARIAADGACLSSDGTPVQNATLNPDGTWTAGPFDVTGSVFLEGVEMCARARATYANGDVSEVATSNTPVKDTVAPALGSVAFSGAYGDDGYINIAEAAPGASRPVTWTGALDATSSEGRFTDPSDAIIAGGNCGPFTLGASGTGALNDSCMSVAPQGEIRWQARWFDAAGNVSDWASTSITVDTIAPAAPAITSPVSPYLTNSTSVPVAGTAEADSTVTIIDHGTPRGTATADANGDWATTLTLVEGNHALRARATDAAGNTGSLSDPSVVVDVDMTALPPTVAFDIDPINAADQAAVSVTVDGEDGSSVDVWISDGDGNQTPTQTVTLASPATLVFDVSALLDGTLTATAVLTDPAGNVSEPGTDTAVKDTLGPALGSVAFEGPYADDGYINIVEAAAADPAGRPVTWTGADDAVSAQGRFTDPTDAIITGGSCGPFTLAPTGTGTQGYLNSSCMAAAPQGEIRWQVRWFDAAGNASDWASTSILVDTIAPPVTVTSPADGASVAPTDLTVTGTTEPNAPLSFTVDGLPAGTGTADGDGNWTATFSGLTDGAHVIEATATDVAGNPGSATLNVIVDRLIPVIVLPEEGSLQPGQVTVSGTVKPFARVEVFEGATLIGSTEANALGEWAVVVGLATGVHTITARGIDATTAGVSAFTGPRTFTVDASRPTVQITTANMSVFPGTAVIDGKATDDKGVVRVELQYFNVVGSKVLTQDATCATCGENAPAVDWTASPALTLPGIYSVQAYAIDGAGNRSLAATITFVKI